ncbi:MAG: hypothetical protein V3W44_07880 [Dehalococcoidales bacterium]
MNLPDSAINAISGEGAQIRGDWPSRSLSYVIPAMKSIGLMRVICMVRYQLEHVCFAIVLIRVHMFTCRGRRNRICAIGVIDAKTCPR